MSIWPDWLYIETEAAGMTYVETIECVIDADTVEVELEALDFKIELDSDLELEIINDTLFVEIC